MLLNRHHQRGLTLIELIIFIVIVGVAVVGVLGVISLNTKHSADPARRKQAMAIAEGMMEEVRSSAFTFCDITDQNLETAQSENDCVTKEGFGLEPGSTGRPYDNVSDYGSISGAVSYGGDVLFIPCTSSSSPPPVCPHEFPTGYLVTVSVANDGNLGSGPDRIPSNEVLRILVTVTYGAEKVELESYRTRFAPRNLPISPASPL